MVKATTKVPKYKPKMKSKINKKLFNSEVTQHKDEKNGNKKYRENQNNTEKGCGGLSYSICHRPAVLVQSMFALVGKYVL